MPPRRTTVTSAHWTTNAPKLLVASWTAEKKGKRNEEMKERRIQTKLAPDYRSVTVTAFLSVTLFLRFTSFNTSFPTREVLESTINNPLYNQNYKRVESVLFLERAFQIIDKITKESFDSPLDLNIFGKVGWFDVQERGDAEASEGADFDRHFVLAELHFGLSFDNDDELGHWLTTDKQRFCFGASFY